MSCEKQSIKHTRGDTLSFKGQVLADGVAVDITEANIKYSMRNNMDKEGEPLITGDATITNAAQGLYEIDAECDLDLGIYYFDIQLTDTQNRIFTLYKGTIEITYDVT